MSWIFAAPTEIKPFLSIDFVVIETQLLHCIVDFKFIVEQGTISLVEPINLIVVEGQLVHSLAFFAEARTSTSFILRFPSYIKSANPSLRSA